MPNKTMLLFEQKYSFSAIFIPIIIIFVLQTSACVIDDGNTHPENDYRRAKGTVWNNGVKHPDTDSRQDNGNKNGDIKHEHTKLSENYNNKSEIGNKTHDDSVSRRYDGNISHKGNILRSDGYFAGKPPDGNVVGELDATPSYVELFKDHTMMDNKYSPRPTTEENFNKRTPPFRVTLEDDCMYSAYYCLKVYKTGPVCGRTLYYSYQDFKNYCMLDYVNCMEKYEMWQIVHMGGCMNITRLTDYEHHEYYDESFLDQIYVHED